MENKSAASENAFAKLLRHSYGLPTLLAITTALPLTTCGNNGL